MAQYKEFETQQSENIISFEYSNEGWKLILNVNDNKMYELMSGCNTCEFFFERTYGEQGSLISQEIAEVLEKGVSAIDDDVINTISKIMPSGKYFVYNSQIHPKLTVPFSDADYFSNEQVKLWGREGTI